MFEKDVFTLKTYYANVFSPHYSRANLKPQQSHVILDLCLRRTRSGKSYNVFTVFEKLWYKIFSVYTKMRRPRFLNSFVLKSEFGLTHSRSQRPRSFWSAPRIATSGQVQHRKSAIHGLPVTLRMFTVKFDKSDWFWSQSIVFIKPFKNGMSLDQARGRDSWC